MQLSDEQAYVCEHVNKYHVAVSYIHTFIHTYILACRVQQLLYGMMLPSGNDAATALAQHFGVRMYVR